MPPLYNPIGAKFPSLFENVVPRSLKSIFQLDQQVNISFYLTEATALRHSRDYLIWNHPNVLSVPLAFPDFKINFISLRRL